MKITVLTLFPEMINGFVSQSIIGRASQSGLLNIELVDIRAFTHDKHQVVDDYPYGGGAGMLMKPDPVYEAIETVSEPGSYVVMMTPQGRLFDQKLAQQYSKQQHLVLLCGHYEGIDERISGFVHDHVSIGDYVLTGGELAAAVVLDATARLVPGVLAADSPLHDTFSAGLLEGPQYTRPREFMGRPVPEVLLSGDHEKIRLWRRKESLRRTLAMRPDLFAKVTLSREDLKLLSEIWNEVGQDNA